MKNLLCNIGKEKGPAMDPHVFGMSRKMSGMDRKYSHLYRSGLIVHRKTLILTRKYSHMARSIPCVKRSVLVKVSILTILFRKSSHPLAKSSFHEAKTDNLFPKVCFPLPKGFVPQQKWHYLLRKKRCHV